MVKDAKKKTKKDAGKQKASPAGKAAPETQSLSEQEVTLTRAEYPQFEGLGITPQQQRFVMIYCRPDMAYNATRAYIEAYEKDRVDDYMVAAASATRLLNNVKIQRAVSIEMDRQIGNHDALAKRVLNEWSKLAFVDMTEFIELNGPFVVVKSLEDLPVHFRPAIKSIENTQSGIKVSFHDKNKALECIAKCLGMFTENRRVVDETYESLVQRLAREEKEKNEGQGGESAL